MLTPLFSQVEPTKDNKEIQNASRTKKDSIGVQKDTLTITKNLPQANDSIDPDAARIQNLQNKDELKIITSEKSKKRKRKKKFRKLKPYEPLAPARAAFYSAVFPGLGQAYTGNYWKIPLVYAAIGGAIYYYDYNNDFYLETRSIYKRRIAGFRDDRFIDEDGRELISTESLLNRQKRFRKDRELSALLITLAYILNIIDANVSAHLQQYNINNDLSVRPNLQYNPILAQPEIGLKLQLRLN